jgi:hypothetical protein
VCCSLTVIALVSIPLVSIPYMYMYEKWALLPIIWVGSKTKSLPLQQDLEGPSGLRGMCLGATSYASNEANPLPARPQSMEIDAPNIFKGWWTFVAFIVRRLFWYAARAYFVCCIHIDDMLGSSRRKEMFSCCKCVFVLLQTLFLSNIQILMLHTPRLFQRVVPMIACL